VGALGSALGELAVEVESPALDEPSADALSRGLEWLAAHLPAGEVRWRVPREAAALPGVRRLPGVESLDGSDGPSAVARPRRRASASKAQVARDADVASHAASARPRPEEPMRAAWPARFDPIIGRPHPASPAEQALFRALQRSHLAGTFRPNHPVSTRPGPRLVVDLFGAEPRLVVEIDGYAFHGGPSAFQRDRDRDFCLLASGLRVLRLTHDEIMRSVDEAVAKIRAVVDAGSTEAREREG
jgi:very-short-patch-repair endonuclease